MFICVFAVPPPHTGEWIEIAMREMFRWILGSLFERKTRDCFLSGKVIPYQTEKERCATALGYWNDKQII